MSLPTKQLACDVCGDLARLGPFPRAFYLTERDGPLPVRWTLGWCSGCKRSRRLEDWPHEALLVREGAELLAYAEVQRQRDAEAQTRQGGWLSRLVRREPAKDAPGELAVSRHAQELADLQLYHRLLNVRRSTNRCMECGSTQVWHWYLEKDEAPEHPGCGGHYRASHEDSGIRLNYRGMAVLYDLEGKLLGNVQTDSRDGRPTPDDLASKKPAPGD